MDKYVGTYSLTQQSMQREVYEKEINKLQSNWNSLRELLINEKKLIEEDEFFCNLSNKDYIEFILDKMNELEGKNK